MTISLTHTGFCQLDLIDKTGLEQKCQICFDMFM